MEAMVKNLKAIGFSDITYGWTLNSLKIPINFQARFRYQLSSVYDIVHSRLVFPEEKEEMCLRLQGKRNKMGLSFSVLMRYQC